MTDTISAGIYYGVHCIAQVCHLTVSEAFLFLNRPLHDGEQLSIKHHASGQTLTKKQLLQFLLFPPSTRA